MAKVLLHHCRLKTKPILQPVVYRKQPRSSSRQGPEQTKDMETSPNSTLRDGYQHTLNASDRSEILGDLEHFMLFTPFAPSVTRSEQPPTASEFRHFLQAGNSLWLSPPNQSSLFCSVDQRRSHIVTSKMKCLYREMHILKQLKIY